MASSSSFYTDGDPSTVASVAPDAPSSFYADPQASNNSAAQAAASAAAAAASAASAAATVTGSLRAVNNLSDVASAATALRNLGGIDLSTTVAVTTTTTLTTSAFGKLHLISGAASYTVTLPTPVSNTGAIIALIVDTPTNASKLYTISSPSGKVGRNTSLVMWASEALVVRSDGTNWVIVDARQIPFVGKLTNSTTDVVISSTFTLCTMLVASGDPTGLNLAYDTTNKTFKAPRSGAYQFNAYTYQTQVGGTATNQMQMQGGDLSGVYSWTGALNTGTIYGSALLSVAAGANIGAYGRADGTSTKISCSAVPAELHYQEVVPSW